MPALTYAYGALIGIGGIFGYIGRFGLLSFDVTAFTPGN